MGLHLPTICHGSFSHLQTPGSILPIWSHRALIPLSGDMNHAITSVQLPTATLESLEMHMKQTETIQNATNLMMS